MNSTLIIVLTILVACVIVFYVFRHFQNNSKNSQVLKAEGKQISAKLLQYKRMSLTQVKVTLQLDVEGKKIGKESVISGKSDDFFANLLANEETFLVYYHPSIAFVELV